MHPRALILSSIALFTVLLVSPALAQQDSSNSEGLHPFVASELAGLQPRYMWTAGSRMMTLNANGEIQPQMWNEHFCARDGGRAPSAA